MEDKKNKLLNLILKYKLKLDKNINLKIKKIKNKNNKIKKKSIKIKSIPNIKYGLKNKLPIYPSANTIPENNPSSKPCTDKK